jgi:molecular chaperone DnaJ
MPPAPDDFYGLLGVPRDASDEDLKKAYRRLARELHPDANPGDPTAEERFKQVQLAYEVLRDPEKRARYDQFGIDGLRAGGAGGFDDMGFGGIGDLFDAFFGGGFSGRRRGPSGPPRGADIETVLEIDFEAAVFGGGHDVSVELPQHCESCQGSGARSGTAPVRCTACNGTGEVRRVRQSILGQMVTSTPCGRCGGIGEEITTPCPDCRGDGRRLEARTLTIEVPAGIAEGQTLRLTGRGAAGPRGGASGDLYVHLRVRPHPRFTRQGDDLIEVFHVSMAQAALGVHVDYETLDGTEELVIPSGAQSGRVLRLRGRGVPHVAGRGRGDLLVQIAVDTPTDLTGPQEELLRQFAAERGESVAPPETGLLGRIRSAFK